MKCEVSSFRDPSGAIFYEGGKLLRKINPEYHENYDYLMSSGLYKKLVDEELLIPHEVITSSPFIIKPEFIPFISYPHEWSFSALKEAALTTLKIEKIALEYGMQLKDATAYNIQFYRGKPLLIDTLSFEKRKGALPWIAYKQFCQHFLAPLALHGYVDWRTKDFLLANIDGIPLDLAVRLLPIPRLMNFGFFVHLYLHSKFQTVASVSKNSTVNASLNACKGLIRSLESVIQSIRWKIPKTEWQDYYSDDSYTKLAFRDKQIAIEKYLLKSKPNIVWDIGCNDGFYSLIAEKICNTVIAFDADPVCIDRLFRKKTTILPLLMNLSAPTPSFGWASEERKSLKERGKADLVLALALIHHLLISCGIPLNKMAEYFSGLGKMLLIEFIPKEDKKFKEMTGTSQINFEEYSEETFVNSFSRYFEILDRYEIKDSIRILYLLQSKEGI